MNGMFANYRKTCACVSGGGNSRKQNRKNLYSKGAHVVRNEVIMKPSIANMSCHIMTNVKYPRLRKHNYAT